jgi:signal transduction histidine kinase
MNWSRRHPRLVDCTFAALIFLLSGASHNRADFGMGLLLAAGMAVGVAIRRRDPRAAFVIVAVVGVIQYGLGVSPQAFDIAAVIVLYTVAAHRGRRDAAVAFLALEVGAYLGALRWYTDPSKGLVAPTVLAAAAWVLGDSMRIRRAYLASVEERASRLERERDQQIQIAASAERSRIARELHDIVAHSLSVMVAQADGATYAMERDPDRAHDAMRTVAETGREALTEMRRLLGVLRTSEPTIDTTPQPSVEQVTELVDKVRDAGLSIELRLRGQPRTLPAGMGLAAYRIVQEALTNTLKHAGPRAHAQVTIEYRDEVMEVRVEDDGRADAVVPRQADDRRPGQGLLGMRERAAVYGGRIVARPGPDGGYRVDALLPIPTA